MPQIDMGATKPSIMKVKKNVALDLNQNNVEHEHVGYT